MLRSDPGSKVLEVFGERRILHVPQKLTQTFPFDGVVYKVRHATLTSHDLVDVLEGGTQPRV